MNKTIRIARPKVEVKMNTRYRDVFTSGVASYKEVFGKDTIDPSAEKTVWFGYSSGVEEPDKVPVWLKNLENGLDKLLSFDPSTADRPVVPSSSVGWLIAKERREVQTGNTHSEGTVEIEVGVGDYFDSTPGHNAIRTKHLNTTCINCGSEIAEGDEAFHFQLEDNQLMLHFDCREELAEKLNAVWDNSQILSNSI